MELRLDNFFSVKQQTVSLPYQPQNKIYINSDDTKPYLMHISHRVSHGGGEMALFLVFIPYSMITNHIWVKYSAAYLHTNDECCKCVS